MSTGSVLGLLSTLSLKTVIVPFTLTALVAAASWLTVTVYVNTALPPPFRVTDVLSTSFLMCHLYEFVYVPSAPLLMRSSLAGGRMFSPFTLKASYLQRLGSTPGGFAVCVGSTASVAPSSEQIAMM